MNPDPTAIQSGNRTLASARAAKQDEFYTQLNDISNELKYYKGHIRGKTIFCNCDDPFESNFFKYFAANFNTLGLKKLIAASYQGSPIVGGVLPFEELAGLQPDSKEPYLVEINEVPDLNSDGAINLEDVEHLLRHDKNATRPLRGNDTYGGGDFRSRECVEILKQADIVVSNPPFSLFREYVAQLVEHGKQFLIIGNTNAITYKEIFPLIKDNKLRTGNTKFNVGMFFEVPGDWEHFHHIDEVTGRKIARVSTSCWFTNMDVAKHHEFLPLYKKYSPAEYPKYDNFDAIEVGKVSEIPADYDGVMGVPITFLDKHSLEQFEILGYEKSYHLQTKKYPVQVQVDKSGKKSNVSKLNDGVAIRVERPPTNQTYYIVDGKYYVQQYKRILIKRKD